MRFGGRRGKFCIFIHFRRLPSLFLPSQSRFARQLLLRLATFPRGHECPCEKWSAAPVSPTCFVRWTRSAQLPPRGEPSVPASISAKFVVRQSCKKVHLTSKFSFTHGRKLGSPRGGTNSDRVQRTKQGAVSGAALRFSQAGTAPRRENRLSARVSMSWLALPPCALPSVAPLGLLSLRWARGPGRAETSRRCQWQKQPACFWRSAPVFPSRLWPAPGKWAKHKRSFDSPFVLSRLAAFCGAPRRALAKTGAQRQPRLRCFIHWMRSARLPYGHPTLP